MPELNQENLNTPRGDEKTYLAIAYIGPDHSGEGYVEYANATDFKAQNDELMYGENGIYDCLDDEYYNAHPELHDESLGGSFEKFADSPEKMKWIDEQLNDENLPNTLLRLQKESPMWQMKAGKQITVLDPTPKVTLQKFMDMELFQKNGYLFMTMPDSQGIPQTTSHGFAADDENRELVEHYFETVAEDEYNSWFEYAEEGKIKEMEAMLDRGFPINLKDGGAGGTAVHHAASYNQTDVLKMLVINGADLTITDHFNNPAIFTALKNEGGEQTLDCLITAHTIRSQNEHGQSVLESLFSQSHDSVKPMFDLLIAAGAGVTITRDTVIEAVKNCNDFSIVKDVIRLGVKEGDVTLTPRFLHSLLMTNAKNVTYAAPDVTAHLIDLAKKNNCEAILDLTPAELLRRNLDRPEDFGNGNHIDNKYMNFTPAYLAARSGNEETALALIKQTNVRTNFVEPDFHRSMLHEAVMRGSSKLLSVLAADPKTQNLFLMHDTAGETPISGFGLIHNTSSQDRDKHKNMLKTLINAGCYLNDRDNRGRTAAMGAAIFNNSMALEALIHYGADLTIRDENKKSAVDYALDYENGHCLSILLQQDGIRLPRDLTPQQKLYLTTADNYYISPVAPSEKATGRVVGSSFNDFENGDVFIITQDGKICSSNVSMTSPDEIATLKVGDWVSMEVDAQGRGTITHISGNNKSAREELLTNQHTHSAEHAQNMTDETYELTHDWLQEIRGQAPTEQLIQKQHHTTVSVYTLIDQFQELLKLPRCEQREAVTELVAKLNTEACNELVKNENADHLRAGLGVNLTSMITTAAYTKLMSNNVSIQENGNSRVASNDPSQTRISSRRNDNADHHII